MNDLKKFIYVLSLSAACLGLLSGCGKEAPDGETKPDEVTPSERTSFTLSLMTFNIAVDNRSSENGWDVRKSAVVKMLNKEKPLVLGLQEAQSHVITYIAKFGPKYLRYGLGRDSGNPPKIQDAYDAEEFMMIFWMADSLEAVEKGTFWLSETPQEPGLGWDAECNRNVNWVHFRHKVTRQEFFYFNTHLDHKGTEARTESMKLIAERIREANPSGLPVFLSADFNAKPGNAVFAPINSWMKSTRDVAQVSERTKMTFNGYSAPKSQIDHIFFCGEKVTPLTFRVLDGDYGVTWLSDHYPVVATYHCVK